MKSTLFQRFPELSTSQEVQIPKEQAPQTPLAVGTQYMNIRAIISMTIIKFHHILPLYGSFMSIKKHTAPETVVEITTNYEN